MHNPKCIIFADNSLKENGKQYMNGDFNIRGKNSDKEFENALRPLSFPDFNGQEKIVSNQLPQHIIC